MPSDEELRRVAEDVRALARSLARDLREAGLAARHNGRPAADALRESLREAAESARREFGGRKSRHWGGPWCGFGPGRSWEHWTGWSPRSGWVGPADSDQATPPTGDPAAGGSGDRPRYGAPPWAPPPWAHDRHRRRPPRAPGRPPRTAPPVRRRWDAGVLVGLLVVLFGAAWLIGGLGIVHLSVEAVLAGALMLLGAALVVTGRTDWSLSRHAWPVVLGAVLVVGLFATSSAFGVEGTLSNLSVGDMHTVADGRSTVYGGFGQLRVDLSKVPAGKTVRIKSIAGETTIIPAPNQTLYVSGHVLAGRICLAGAAGDVGTSVSGRSYGSGPDKVTVDVHQLAGDITVGTGGCG